MKLVMDSDCLIKLTKAGLKETLCDAWDVHVPTLVRRETTVPAPALPDAVRIRENIAAGRIVVVATGTTRGKGEDAVLKLYRSGTYDAVATDDARFIRRLRGFGVPFAVPAVIVVKLCQAGVLTRGEAGRALGDLSPHISAEERAAAELMLTGGVAL